MSKTDSFVTKCFHPCANPVKFVPFPPTSHCTRALKMPEERGQKSRSSRLRENAAERTQRSWVRVSGTPKFFRAENRKKTSLSSHLAIMIVLLSMCLFWCQLCTKNCVRCGRSCMIKPEKLWQRFSLLDEFGNFTSENIAPWQKDELYLKKKKKKMIIIAA